MPHRQISPEFIGRDQELSALRAAFDDALALHPAMAFVSGEAGIGKTRLVTEFTDRIAGSARILAGDCPELGVLGLPYAPFVTILRQAARDLGTSHLAEALPGAGPYALAAWLPELGPMASASEYGQTRLFEEILTVVELLSADRPLVLVLEDLHWSDSSSRQLLGFLIRVLRDCRVLIIGTHRPEISGGRETLRAMVSELSRRPYVRAVEPRRLNRHEVGRQLAAIRQGEPDPAFVNRVHDRSQGIPLFVEALNDSGDATPARLKDLLLSGVAELPPESRLFLHAASVSNGEVGHALLSAVTGRDGTGAEAALRAIVDAHIWVTTPHGYAFRHALFRQTVYDQLLPGERARWHRRFAEELSRRPDGDYNPATLTGHWYHAGEHDRAFAAAQQAAEAANRWHAHQVRLQMLEWILDLWDKVDNPERLAGTDRADIHTQIAQICILSGDSELGVHHADLALRDIDPRTQPLRVATVLGARSHLHARLSGDGNPDIDAALALLPEDADPVLRGNLLGKQATIRFTSGNLPGAQESGEAALRFRAAGENGPPTALAALAAVAGFHGEEDKAKRLFALARRTAAAIGDDTTLLTSYLWQVHLQQFHLAEAEPLAREGLELSRRKGLDRSRGSMLAANLAGILHWQGKWRQARNVLEDALASDPPPLYRFVVQINLGIGLALQGDVDTAEAHARAIDDIAGEITPVPHYRVFQPLLRSILAEQRGDLEQAQAGVPPILRFLAERRSFDRDSWEMLSQVMALQRLVLAESDPQQHEGARQRIAQVRDLVSEGSAAGAAGSAGRFRLMVFAGLDDDPVLWDEAANRFRADGMPFYLARCLIHGALADLGRGDRPAAGRRLHEASVIATELGAEPTTALIARITTRAGLATEDAATGASKPAGGLTPREHEVLKLLAEGRSNRQLAAELYISVSTVGVHVSRILAKLKVSSRAEAAAVARRRGWIE